MKGLRGMEKFFDGLAERIERDRFVQDDIHRRRLRAGDFDQRAKACEHDHRDVVFHLFDESRRLIATHLRHHAIENDEIEVVALKFFQGLAPARRRRDRMPIATQISRDDFENSRLVIDNENVQQRFRSRAGRGGRGQRRVFRQGKANDERGSLAAVDSISNLPRCRSMIP